MSCVKCQVSGVRFHFCIYSDELKQTSDNMAVLVGESEGLLSTGQPRLVLKVKLNQTD